MGKGEEKRRKNKGNNIGKNEKKQKTKKGGEMDTILSVERKNSGKQNKGMKKRSKEMGHWRGKGRSSN